MKQQLAWFALGALFCAGLAAAAPLPHDAPAGAATANRHRADPNQQLKHLTKRLNLTADQQNQLLPILTDRQQQMSAVLNDNSLSPQDRRAKLRALREDSNAKIKAVLTGDQKQQYEQMRSHRKRRESNS